VNKFDCIAGDLQAVGFREFWGERSQLRRFHDGVVKEVVVWGDKKEEVIGKNNSLLSNIMFIRQY
jgi:hypothetical protein